MVDVPEGAMSNGAYPGNGMVAVTSRARISFNVIFEKGSSTFFMCETLLECSGKDVNPALFHMSRLEGFEAFLELMISGMNISSIWHCNESHSAKEDG